MCASGGAPRECRDWSPRGRKVAATASGHEQNHQLDLLDEALQLLLSSMRPEDLVLQITGIRWVTDRWWIDAVLQWSGAQPEDKGIGSLAIGVSPRIAAIGPP